MYRQKNVILFIIFLGSIAYCLSFFFRGSVAPIVDVFKKEFNATSSEFGFMSSVFWLSYFVVQIPSGIIIQFITPEFMLLITIISFTVLAPLFSLPFYPFNSGTIMIPTIIFIISGVALGPILLAVMAYIGTRMGSNNVAFIGGITFFTASFFLFAANLLQAWLYQKYQIWREVYWALSLIMFIITILFCIATYIESQTSELDIYDENTSRAIPLLPSNDSNATHAMFCIKIKRECDDTTKGRIGKAVKYAFINPWNWLLGIHYFGALGVKYAFNGLWLISYMSLKFGYSRSLSTFISGTYFVADAVFCVISGKLSAKYKKRKVFYIICGVLLLAPNYIIYCSNRTSMYIIILINIITGIATGIASIPWALIKEYNDHYQSSDVAGGLYNTVSSSAGFVMQWLAGILMDYSWKQRNGEMNDDNDRVYTVADYDLGFTVIPICSAIYLLIAFVIKETNGNTIQWDDRKTYFTRFFC